MSEVFLKVVNMSISASWLVIAVALLRLVLKKAPKWVIVLLWGFVAVRLICPVSFESALSLIPSAEPIPEQVITNLVVDVPSEIPRVDVSVQDQTDTPVRDETGDETGVDVVEPEKPGISVVTVLTALWAAGVGVMLIYTAVSYLLLRRRVATAIPLEKNIYQSENVDSPFVLGVLKPKIYLPFRMDSRDLAYVIAHEQAHIRRKDHWWKPFGFVLLAIHWFNPIIWAGFILLCRDIELACDEKVIKEMDNETKADYTEALVACSVNRRVIAACPLAFGEVGVKERVKTVMNYKKPAFWIVIAAVALCIVVAVCFLTNPKTPGLEVDNPALLEFPGLKWGMTVEEVKAALNLEEDQISAEYDGEKVCRLVVKDLTLFDNQVEIALFDFLPPERGQYGLVPSETGVFGLSDIQAYFTEDTDMIKVRDTMIEIYGEGNTYGHTAHYLIDGEIVERIWPGETSAEYHYYWPGSSKTKDVIPAGKMQEEIAHYASVFPEATMDTIEELIGLRTLGLIGLVDHTVKEGYTPATGYTGKCVKFYGSDICQLLLNYGK